MMNRNTFENVDFITDDELEEIDYDDYNYYDDDAFDIYEEELTEEELLRKEARKKALAAENAARRKETEEFFKRVNEQAKVMQKVINSLTNGTDSRKTIDDCNRSYTDGREIFISPLYDLYVAHSSNEEENERIENLLSRSL